MSEQDGRGSAAGRARGSAWKRCGMCGEDHLRFEYRGGSGSCQRCEGGEVEHGHGSGAPGRKGLNFKLDPEALEILERYAPAYTHKRGRFLSRLLYEYAIRMEERQRQRREEELRDE